MVVEKYGLIIFDLDGTLADRDSDELYPDALKWINEVAHSPGGINPVKSWCIATNQGGIALHHDMKDNGWGNPEKFPTLADFEKRIQAMFPGMGILPYKPWLMMCAAYEKKNGNWCPTPDWGVHLAMFDHDWRKPSSGMLEHAMTITGWLKKDTLMVGDRDEDKAAAESAGCDFMWAWDFFGREQPEQNE